MIDFGKDNYAGVTWSVIPVFDGRWIFLGWMSIWQYANQVPTVGWRSALTLPWELSLEPVGNAYILNSTPVKELDGIRTESMKLGQEVISGKKILDLTELEPSQYDIRFTFKIDPDADRDLSDFGLLLENKQGQKLAAGYDLKNSEVFIDRSESGKAGFSEHFPGKHTAPYAFQENGLIHIRALVDKSSIELFMDDGRVVMTELFFPDIPFSSLSFYSSGGSIELLEGSISGLKSCW